MTENQKQNETDVLNQPIMELRFVKTLRSQRTSRYMKLSFFSLFWIYVVASVLGLIGEDIFHMIVYGGWESRAGYVWGPFSPIYGLGAILLTVCINRIYYTHNIVIFLVAMAMGTFIEFGASWIMEYVFHAIAWDYHGTIGSIDGRTNLVFGMIWGAVGLIWARTVLPLIKSIFDRIGEPSRFLKVVTILFFIFILVDTVVTLAAVYRQSERVHNIPASNPVAVWLDEQFPDEFIQKRFQNVTITTDVNAQKGTNPNSFLI